MRERPIIMSAESVRAILAGTKAQTRRVVKGVNNANCLPVRKGVTTHVLDAASHGLCPHGQPGDRLWVRETWYDDIAIMRPEDTTNDGIYYRADGEAHEQFEDTLDFAWSSPLFMPRWASRLTLELTDVRVERVQDISGDDAFAEGIQVPVSETRGDMARPLLRLTGPVAPSAVSATHPREWNGGDFARFEYANLWDALNAKRGYPWEANPWVWVLTFQREVAS